MSSRATSKNVLQPMRFVDAYYNFSPIQKDFIMLVQQMTDKKKVLESEFNIDLKPYFKSKGVELSNIRHQHYQELTDDLMKSKVTFKYHKGDTLYLHQNLFNRCKVTKDFILQVKIIDDVLPLFYINKLEEGHFRDTQLVKELFQQSYPEYDKYVYYHSDTYVEFKESSTKKLFEKLLQYRKLEKFTFEFTKDELYLLLGYGFLRDKPADPSSPQIFNIIQQEFVQIAYKGSKGWKSLRPLLNKWLKQINDSQKSGLKIKTVRGNFFYTMGRPIRSIFISVEYLKEQSELTNDQQKAFEFLKPYGLSVKQKFRIITDFDYQTILRLLTKGIVAKRDASGNRYYGEYNRPDHRKIDNVPGYVYGVIFGYGKRKL